MLISFHKKFLFLHWPKTGGTSLTRSLLPYARFRDWLAYSHERTLLLRLAFPNTYRSPQRIEHFSGFTRPVRLQVIENHFGRQRLEPLLKFTITRNPFSATWSHYAHIMRSPTHTLHDLGITKTFGAYLDHLCRPSAPTQWVQSVWSDGDEPALDFVGRFECFSEDMRMLSEALSIPALNETRHLNKGAAEAPDYPSLFGNRLTPFVRHYERDFQFFGYSIDPGKALEAPVNDQLYARPLKTSSAASA